MIPSLPHMASATIAGRSFLLILHGFLVAADALPMIGLFEIKFGFGPVAGRALNLLTSLHQFTFIKDIFALFIEVVAILAGQSLFSMEVMLKDHSRPLFPCPTL